MSRIKYYHLLLIVVLLGAGTLYLPSLHYPFVWDDMAVVRDNPYIRSSGSIGLFFQPSFWQKRVPISRFDYRPLQMIVLSAISRLAGANPFFFRAANILIHLLVTCLLWRFILLVGGGRRIALLAAALFAFHPVHVETVVSARNISVLLVAAFLLLSFLLFFRRGGIVTLTLSVSFFLLALLCKESALIYPPILTATVLILRRRFPGISLWRTVPFWIGAVAGGVGKILISSGGPLRDPPALSNLVVGGIRQIGINLRLLILPAQLKVLYSFNKPVSWTRPEWFLPLLVGAGLILIAFKLYRDNRLLFWSIFCLIFSLLPSLAKIGQIGRVVAEQRLYVPSIFFCIAAAVLLNFPGSPERRRRFRLLFGIAGILICLSFAGLIREYLPCWRSNLTLWTRVTILSPRSALAYNNLASVYHRQNNDCRAMVELKEALRCNPEHKEAHSNLGVLHSLAGRQDKAIFEFEESLRSDPTYYPASLHLAKIYLRQRRLDEAEDVLRGVITINAYLPKAYNALAIVLEEAGRSREAEKYYREADALNPEYVVPLRNLTALYHERKDFDRAIETGREAIKRRPGHPKGYIILARVFITMGRFEEARSLLQKSLKTNPENWRTRSLLMALESEGGRTSNQ